MVYGVIQQIWTGLCDLIDVLHILDTFHWGSIEVFGSALWKISFDVYAAKSKIRISSRNHQQHGKYQGCYYDHGKIFERFNIFEIFF